MKAIVSVDCRQVIDSDAIKKQLHHKENKSRRKANKDLKKDTTMSDFGKFYLVKTNVAIAPFNTRKGTEYMLPANTVCVAVNMVGWVALYITNGQQFDSIEDIKAKCKHVRAHKPDFRVVGEVMFRTADKVAIKRMLPQDWASHESYVAAVGRVYNVSK